MSGDFYECQDCKTRIAAADVEGVHAVWPLGVDRDASGDGRVEVTTRPASVLCWNHGERPKQMRRIQAKEKK